ncbi:MAG TPA: ABC transporter permease [Fimbriimonadaceae bacterium]|nr:ABC transporter permease [Fimbriimonadaceae bacterium]
MNEILAILPYAAPVAYAALGETIGERSGVINIGLEGTMLFAAYGGLVGVSHFHGPYPVLVGLLLGCLFGVIVAVGSGFLTVLLKADQVVVGTAINLLALGVTGTLFRVEYGHSGKLLSVPTLSRISGIDWVVAGLVVAVPAVWLLLHRTRWGLAVRSTGEYPRAAEAAGYSVPRLRLQAAALGGALAGLGGSYLVLGTAGGFTENMTNGRGFVAIALVTFGRMNPWLVFGAALLIGYLDALQLELQAKGTAVPREVLISLPYLVALIVLVGVGKRRVAS